MRPLKHGSVELVLGNIVDQDTDAIVNAANTSLAGGGGVDGAIHRAAGPTLKQLCLKLPEDERGRRCQTGHVQVTAAGNLPAKFVIHAVGPFYNERYAEKCHAQLRQVHTLALQAAVQHGCDSVAFPAISTGAYRFPIVEAARIAVDVVASFLQTPPAISLVRFVLFKQTQYDVFAETLANWSPAG
ncbi:macro domain-containing protein [Novipirellula sp.]|uniref:macro domain-containing protein n=1 Tax=Novipirellula sp. TaxID=2795430 RepID=UPI003561FF67